MDVNIFSGCHYFQWISLFSVHANAAMKEETLLETKTALHGNQPGDYTLKHFYHKPQDVSQSSNNLLSWLSICPTAGIVATVSMGLGCGWIATRAVVASSVVQSHHHRHHHLEHQQHLEHQWHRHQQPLEHDCNYATCPITLVHGIKSSSSCHLHLKQANGGGALLHVTNRFQCLCGFFAFLSVCFFYSHHHGGFSLAYCANCVFLLFLGAKIMASPRT